MYSVLHNYTFSCIMYIINTALSDSDTGVDLVNTTYGSSSSYATKVAQQLTGNLYSDVKEETAGNSNTYDTIAEVHAEES